MEEKIIKVPPNFEHPKGSNGQFEPGAHLPLLYSLPPERLTCFQIYENTSEGTPVSPIFADQRALEQWLLAHGYSEPAVRQFIQRGHAPLLVVKSDGKAIDGIEGMRHVKHDDPSNQAQEPRATDL